MGLGYTLFGKPLLLLLLVLGLALGIQLLPEYWPDRYVVGEAIRHDDLAAVGRYIARGLDPNDRSQWRSWPRRTFGRTAGGRSMPELGPADESLLSFATVHCSTEAARLLVNAGADVTSRGRDGATPLYHASMCHDTGLVAALLARGADPNAPEPDGGTALWERTNLGWRRRPHDAAIVDALERAGARRP